jgi:hypothetical protein
MQQYRPSDIYYSRTLFRFHHNIKRILHPILVYRSVLKIELISKKIALSVINQIKHPILILFSKYDYNRLLIVDND